MERSKGISSYRHFSLQLVNNSFSLRIVEGELFYLVYLVFTSSVSAGTSVSALWLTSKTDWLIHWTNVLANFYTFCWSKHTAYVCYVRTGLLKISNITMASLLASEVDISNNETNRSIHTSILVPPGHNKKTWQYR